MRDRMRNYCTSAFDMIKINIVHDKIVIKNQKKRK